MEVYFFTQSKLKFHGNSHVLLSWLHGNPAHAISGCIYRHAYV